MKARRTKQNKTKKDIDDDDDKTDFTTMITTMGMITVVLKPRIIRVRLLKMVIVRLDLKQTRMTIVYTCTVAR